jgi:hypothetical protein
LKKLAAGKRSAAAINPDASVDKYTRAGARFLGLEEHANALCH